MMQPGHQSHPTLLLLHGLGATSGVWADVEARLDWPGRIVAPDLAGHGAAPWCDDYSLGALAAGVSAQCQPGEETIIVGHSLGGGVGICLASGFFRPTVRTVIGLGVKVAWTDDDVAGMAKVAARGVRWFDSKQEAVERFLRQSGLAGIVDHDHPAVENAVVAQDGRWRVAQDPATFAQSALEMPLLQRAARCPVVLGAGQSDAMSTEADLARYVNQPQIAPGRGHNVQVEDPDWVVGLIETALRDFPTPPTE